MCSNGHIPKVEYFMDRDGITQDDIAAASRDVHHALWDYLYEPIISAWEQKPHPVIAAIYGETNKRLRIERPELFDSRAFDQPDYPNIVTVIDTDRSTRTLDVTAVPEAQTAADEWKKGTEQR
tara:strand:- start:47 stop:415 length:369 start_codon:yes stop_codon:yes gene_type:complete